MTKNWSFCFISGWK